MSNKQTDQYNEAVRDGHIYQRAKRGEYKRALRKAGIKTIKSETEQQRTIREGRF